jgi:Rifampin ADP-ribosyl transferase
MSESLDQGPFFHGTKAALNVGDEFSPGFESNYRPGLIMNHIYFTATLSVAGLAAELAHGEATPMVYLVEPLGDFENDPNVTDKKFPGNPTRSYRSTAPVRVVEVVEEWPHLSAEDLEAWRNRLIAIRADTTAEILN